MSEDSYDYEPASASEETLKLIAQLADELQDQLGSADELTMEIVLPALRKVLSHFIAIYQRVITQSEGCTNAELIEDYNWPDAQVLASFQCNFANLVMLPGIKPPALIMASNPLALLDSIFVYMDNANKKLRLSEPSILPVGVTELSEAQVRTVQNDLRTLTGPLQIEVKAIPAWINEVLRDVGSEEE